MNKGLSFEIPNKYGNLLRDLLKPIDFNKYKFHISNDEVHLIIDEKFSDDSLFTEDLLEGPKLLETIEDKTYYMIFLTLQAFKKDEVISEFVTYKEFIESNCEFFMVVYDCSYVVIWCKDEEILERFHENATVNGYGNIEYKTSEQLDGYRVC